MVAQPTEEQLSQVLEVLKASTFRLPVGIMASYMVPLADTRKENRRLVARALHTLVERGLARRSPANVRGCNIRRSLLPSATPT
jgi:hypothetical protein